MPFEYTIQKAHCKTIFYRGVLKFGFGRDVLICTRNLKVDIGLIQIFQRKSDPFVVNRPNFGLILTKLSDFMFQISN